MGRLLKLYVYLMYFLLEQFQDTPTRLCNNGLASSWVMLN